jgi:hypothetical protein
LFVRFWQNEKKSFPSSSLETNKQQQTFSSCVCSFFGLAQNEKIKQEFRQTQNSFQSWAKRGILWNLLASCKKKKMKFFFSLVYSFTFSEILFERKNKVVQLGCPPKKSFC